jgi:hypothetical protein
MDQEMMQLKHELKEFVEKGQHILQKMEGSMGQRYYGMRGGQGGYSGNQGGGYGGNYGNREPWMQGGYPMQEQWPQHIDPKWFM